VPVRDRRPEDERPLFRAVNEQRLIGPVGGGQDSQEETQSTQGSPSATQATGASQAGKGPIATAIDKAEQNNWVYPSMAQMAREKGLLDKADEVLGRLKAQVGSR
jgi:outer membrane biosynthesis protein TonB